MTKQEIITQVRRLLQEETINLTRDEYREVLDEIGSDIDLSLDSLNEEDTRAEKEGEE